MLAERTPKGRAEVHPPLPLAAFARRQDREPNARPDLDAVAADAPRAALPGNNAGRSGEVIRTGTYHKPATVAVPDEGGAVNTQQVDSPHRLALTPAFAEWKA